MNDRDLHQFAAQWARGIREAGESGAVALAPDTSASGTGPRKRSLPMVNHPIEQSLDVGFDVHRPKTRADCLEMERPCPFVSCKYHLYLDVSKSGVVSLSVPDLEVWEMIDTCTLDVAEDGSIPGTGEGDGMTLESVALIYSISRERVRQIEAVAQRKLRKRLLQELPEYVAEYGWTPRRAVERDADDDEQEDVVEDEGEDGEP